MHLCCTAWNGPNAMNKKAVAGFGMVVAKTIVYFRCLSDCGRVRGSGVEIFRGPIIGNKTVVVLWFGGYAMRTKINL